MKKLVLIKIGGGLITDKTSPLTVREDMMQAASVMIATAIKNHPDTAFIVGNGAGSFGHYLASKEAAGDSENARTERISGIHGSVTKLNSIFVEHLKTADIQAVSFSPAEHITAKDGVVIQDSLRDMLPLIEASTVPVVFGDIVDDGSQKGLIFSTEDLLQMIAERLHKDFDEMRIIYAGETDGVLDEDGATIPQISAGSWQSMSNTIKAPPGYDVTGGMLHKIESALKIARLAKSVHIISGKGRDNASIALSDGRVGTKIIP